MTHRSRTILSSTAALTLILGMASAATAAEADTVLAVVNGKVITEAEVRAATAAELRAAELEHQKSVHKILEGGLDELIDQDLIDAEAAARGVTPGAIVAGIKPAVVTEADVDTFYEENKAQIPEPKEQVLGQIRTYLEQASRRKANDDLLATLNAKYKVVKSLDPLRIAVAATGPADGPENAPVTLVEFSDFQCPFCGQLFPTLSAVKARYGDKLRIVFRQYPLPFHPFAAKAAEASLCANEQGKFWQMHDAMFKDQNALGVEDLKKSAAAIGLDAPAFAQCLDSGQTAATVQSDLAGGGAAGVDGTPAMFINGRFVNGAVPLEEITAVIDDELRRQPH